MSKEKFKKAIAESLLKNSVTATSWTLSLLVEIGALTVQSFLSPSIYADLPNITGIFSTKAKVVVGKKKYKEITIRQSLRRLEKYGFVERKDMKYIPTSKGRELIKKILLVKKEQNRPWDKKYRVVIFDIPESQRKFRNLLRRRLCSLKYKKLQNSVFIGKKPLPDDIVEEIKKNKLGNCVNYLLVDKVYKNVL